MHTYEHARAHTHTHAYICTHVASSLQVFCDGEAAAGSREKECWSGLPARNRDTRGIPGRLTKLTICWGIEARGGRIQCKEKSHGLECRGA